MQTVRWGILGTGKIARAFATALRDTPGAQLAAVASRSEDSARQFADAFGVPRAYGSYAALAADAALDLVYIATPHPMHAQNALMLLDAGKGVLCEKPFTMHAGEAREVVARARAQGLFLMEAMWTRFLPAVTAMRGVLDSGQLGAPRQISADFGFAAQFGPEHRVFNPALGGGALLDIGIYPLSLAAAVLGPVVAVQAQAEMGPTGVDVQTAFTLRHAGGGLSACACSFVARTPCEFTVSGERGHVRLNTMFHRARSLTVVRDDGSSDTIDAPYLGNGYVHQAIEAQRCWQAGLIESPLMPHDESLALMAVMDEIRRQIGLRYPADC